MTEISTSSEPRPSLGEEDRQHRKPWLSHSVPFAGLMWLLAGGIAHTVGMEFFAAGRVPYCHFAWHLFVMAGTAYHVVAVWFYVV